MTSRDELLVAIIPGLLDMNIARNRHWYRIPVERVEKLLKKRWPPKWLAFYQPKIFGREAYAINYYARVQNISQVFRWELFPDLPRDNKRQERYYKIELSPLERLFQPIGSRRGQRTTFIQTTWEKLMQADEINDLYDDSLLEDLLWTELKLRQIDAVRQACVEVGKNKYFLDFAIYCANGKINVETDGDMWHSDKERIPQDNQRDNDIQTAGWCKLRFNTHHVKEQMREYCIPTIVENINRLGGLKEEGRFMPRPINSDEAQWEQLTLF